MLLMEPRSLPQALAAARPLLERFRSAIAAAGASPLSAALGFVRRLPEVDRIVVGVHSAGELAECIGALGQPAPQTDFSAFACTDEDIVDPRRWTHSE
jgi:aryl-alcohol dehydrogenase-like predicted oxidoreductase